MAQPEIIEALRAATGDAHQALEVVVDMDNRLDDPIDRLGLVRGFHRLHASAEPAMAPWLGSVSGLEFETRRRAERVAADLADLNAGRVHAPAAASGIDSLGQALGWFYVLEGSSLGGRIIHKGLTARGQDLSGLAFLDPYGEAVGARWRDFVAVLDREVQAGRAAASDVIAGAQAAFDHAQTALAPQETACPTS